MVTNNRLLQNTTIITAVVPYISILHNLQFMSFSLPFSCNITSLVQVSCTDLRKSHRSTLGTLKFYMGKNVHKRFLLIPGTVDSKYCIWTCRTALISISYVLEGICQQG